MLGFTSLIYGFQTLYVNVDNKIIKGGKHSMRHKVFLGVTWACLHTPYHICLVLLATGLGIAFRDIIIVPVASGAASSGKSAVGEAVHFVMRGAATLSASSGPHFTPMNRWLFSIGWGGSMLLSAMFSMTHHKGRREATKYARLLLRSGIAISLGVWMPFTKLPAGAYLLVHSLVTSVISFTEFILVQADAADVIGSALRGSELDDTPRASDKDDGKNAAKDVDDKSENIEALHERSLEGISDHALRRRMSQRGRHRLERVDVDGLDNEIYEHFSPRSLISKK